MPIATNMTEVFQKEIEAEYKAFILEQRHPCIMAKTVFFTRKLSFKDL